MANVNELRAELTSLNARRDQLLGSQDRFSANALTEMGRLNQQVASLQAQIDRLTAQSSVEELCTVTISQAGKNDRFVETPVGTTCYDLLTNLGIAVNNVSIKRLVGGGGTADIGNARQYSFGSGAHTIFVSPRVVGGC